MTKQDPQSTPAEPEPTTPEPGPKGEPDLKAENARLTQERDSLKARAEDAEGQLATFKDSLAKALTEDDVKAAVEAAQADAKAATEAAQAFGTLYNNEIYSLLPRLKLKSTVH